MKEIKAALILLLLGAGTTHWPVYGQSADDIASAESTFKFLAINLQNFQRTGRIDDELGIDGSEYQYFIQLLETSYIGFTRDFAPDSSFCKFYRDPQNSIMEYEERAILAFQYLPGLRGRLEYFIGQNRQFEQEVQDSLGGQVLDRIRRLKTNASSFEFLPTRDFDAAETVNFADTACQ